MCDLLNFDDFVIKLVFTDRVSYIVDTLASSDDQDEIQQNMLFHAGLRKLLR